MALSSSDLRYNQVVQSMQQFFGDKVQIDHQDINEYTSQTGNKIPAKFWSIARVARGVFSLQNALIQDTSSVEQQHQVVDFPIKQTVVSQQNSVVAGTISKFVYDEMIPQIKDTYVEWGNYKTVELLLKSNKFFTLYITGDSGSGKNEMIAHACAKLNRPLVRVSMTRETKEEHLIGSKTLLDGSIVYEEGPVVWACLNGAVLLVDEISSGDANELMCLQAILEGNSFFVKSANKLVTPKEGFCIIATDNTKGRGSDSGRYIGTNILNDAFLERFEMTMEQGYPTEKVERKIIEKLMQKINLDDQAFLDRLVTWVHAIRKTYLEEGLEEHITTRRACHIVRTYDKVRDAALAIELCTARFDETTIMAMRSLWDKLTPTAAVDSVIEEQMEPEQI